MPFDPEERKALLLIPRIGPGVIDRLEALGIDSAEKLSAIGVDETVQLVCRALGSPAWRNRHAALVEAAQQANAPPAIERARP